MGTTDEPAETAVCVWCGHDISRERGVCQGCGSPITQASRMVMADPQVVARRPAGSMPVEPTPAPPVPTGGPRSTPEPSRGVHTARVVGLIVSAVSGPPTAEGRPGLVIRFFTPQGQLITEIRPGAPSYDEALRLALD